MAHLLISAAHKSSGKTTITLGLCAALKRRGHEVQSFKKGPDYIDPMWLSAASGRPCHNLDFHTMGDDEILATFAHYQADINLIEGNMGLFDSIDVEGSNSNATMAALVKAPVVLVVDVKGMTRSAVPLIMGYQHFDPNIRIAGVILNNVAGSRHETRLRAVIDHYINIPILGVIHRDPKLVIDERHLGLIPSNEAQVVAAKLDYIADVIERQVDIDQVIAQARQAEMPAFHEYSAIKTTNEQRIRIGIARDAAFSFYYPGDLDRLQEAGAELVEIDCLRDSTLPAIDGLFIGGGFPETQVEALAANESLRTQIRDAIEAGLPTYAECGGLMYLTRSIRWGDQVHPMVGIIPADTVMYEKPMGRGYVQLTETGDNPWPRDAHAPQAQFNAHEFHYSTLENIDPGLKFAYRMQRGTGIDGRHDGIIYKNLVANYVHLRDVSAYHWTQRFVEFVHQCRHKQSHAPLELVSNK